MDKIFPLERQHVILYLNRFPEPSLPAPLSLLSGEQIILYLFFQEKNPRCSCRKEKIHIPAGSPDRHNEPLSEFFSGKWPGCFSGGQGAIGLRADIKPCDAQCQRIVTYIGKAGVANHPRESFRGWELDDGIGKIKIGRRVSGETPGHAGQEPAEIEAAQKLQNLLLRELHLQYGHLAAFYENPGKLPERSRTVWNVADPEGYSHHVKRPVRKGKGQGVTLDEGYPVPAFLPTGGFHYCFSKHFQDKINAGYFNIRIAARHLQGQIRRAGGHVQVTTGPGEMHLPGGKAPPGNIAPETEQVVEKIVLSRNRRKYILNDANVVIRFQVLDRGVIPLQAFFQRLRSFSEVLAIFLCFQSGIAAVTVLRPFRNPEPFAGFRPLQRGFSITVQGGSQQEVFSLNPPASRPFGFFIDYLKMVPAGRSKSGGGHGRLHGTKKAWGRSLPPRDALLFHHSLFLLSRFHRQQPFDPFLDRRMGAEEGPKKIS
jgi:hypothetical protein